MEFITSHKQEFRIPHGKLNTVFRGCSSAVEQRVYTS